MEENNANDDTRFVLTLFVSGASPNSVRAITNLEKILKDHLSGRYELKIVDVHQEKAVAEKEQIIALPLLIKRFPLPERRLIGDMSDTKKVLRGLGILID